MHKGHRHIEHLPLLGRLSFLPNQLTGIDELAGVGVDNQIVLSIHIPVWRLIGHVESVVEGKGWAELPYVGTGQLEVLGSLKISQWSGSGQHLPVYASRIVGLRVVPDTQDCAVESVPFRNLVRG